MDYTSRDEHRADVPITPESTGDATDNAPRQRRRGPRHWSMRQRITVALGVTAVTVALAVGADVAVLAHRPAHVDIAMPSTSSSAARR